MKPTLGLLLLLSGCSLYFDKDTPGDTGTDVDGGPASDPNVLTRPCLRAMLPYKLEVGATAHPTRLFITYVCEGGAIIENIAFDGTGFSGDTPRGDFQDSSDRLIGRPGTADILMISAHRSELWLFNYNSGQRMSFENAFSDIWIGDVDADTHRDFVLTGGNAIRMASAESPVYGYPLYVAAADEHPLLASAANYRYAAIVNLVGDSRPDVFYVAGGGGSPFAVGLAEQTGPRTFTGVESIVEPTASSGTSQPLRVADVDGDGKPDIIGTTSRLFIRSSRYGTMLFLDDPVGAIATGDVDGDGTDDVLYVTADKTAVRRVKIGTMSGTPVITSEPLLAEGGDVLEAADFDADRRADIALIRDVGQPTSTLVFRLASTL